SRRPASLTVNRLRPRKRLTRRQRGKLRRRCRRRCCGWRPVTFPGINPMKATRILLFSGIAFLLAIFVVGIYLVPKLQAGNPATARQSDATRVSLSDVFVDVTYATPQFVKRVKLEPYLEQWQNRAQPFLIGINTHVGTIADLDL